MSTDESFEKLSGILALGIPCDSNTDKSTLWYDSWSEMWTEYPEIAWQAILELLKQDLTPEQLSLLAAGPLEELLLHHGSAFIERVEREAETNKRFSYLIGGVWRSEIPQDVWNRVEKVQKETW